MSLIFIVVFVQMMKITGEETLLSFNSHFIMVIFRVGFDCFGEMFLSGLGQEQNL